jgi:hypothetical protein
VGIKECLWSGPSCCVCKDNVQLPAYCVQAAVCLKVPLRGSPILKLPWLTLC